MTVIDESSDRSANKPAPVEDYEIVDPSALKPLTRGASAVEKKILTEYQRATHEDAAALETAIDRGELAKAARASHRLKDASLMVGVNALAAVCDCIERASRAKYLTTVQRNMDAFHRELERVDGYIKGFNNRVQAG